MRNVTIAIALAGTLVMGAAAAADNEERVLLDRVAAVVNGRVITLSEVETAAGQLMAGLPAGIDVQAARVEAMRAAMRGLIDEKLLEHEILERRIEVTEQEIDRAIVEVRRQHNLTDSEFRQALQAQGFDWEEYRRELASQLERYKLLGAEVQARVEVTDEDVRSYLARTGVGRAAEEAQVSHILVGVGEGAPAAEEDEAREAAEAALERLEAGEDFAAVARELSDDRSAEAGGVLGWLRKGRMASALEGAVFSAEPGEIVGPVRSASGWHVIKVSDRRRVQTERDEFAEQRARQALVEEALEQETRRFLDGLRRRAVIEIKISEIEE